MQVSEAHAAKGDRVGGGVGRQVAEMHVTACSLGKGINPKGIPGIVKRVLINLDRVLTTYYSEWCNWRCTCP